MTTETCTRCGIGTEHCFRIYTLARGKIILCSDCCVNLIDFLVGTNIIDPKEVIDYTENTNPTSPSNLSSPT